MGDSVFLQFERARHLVRQSPDSAGLDMYIGPAHLLKSDIYTGLHLFNIPINITKPYTNVCSLHVYLIVLCPADVKLSEPQELLHNEYTRTFKEFVPPVADDPRWAKEVPLEVSAMQG